MRTYLTLVTKETAGILKSPPILFATGFFVLLDAFAFYLTTARAGAPLAEFDEIALFILFSSIFLYPLVAMNLFAENNADGTIESLLTAPVSAGAAILAKFAAGMVFVLLHLVHALVFAILLDYGGNLDWQATAAGFIALFAFGMFAMSLGVFISSLTVSQAAAAAGTGGVLVFLAIAADLDPYSGHTADVLHSMSYFPHARRWIAGQIDVRGILYFVSTTVFFLFAAWLAITNREPQKRTSNPTVRRRLAVTYLLVMAGVVLVLTQGAILHITGFWESGTPLGPALARVPWSWLLPLILASGAFVWSILTFRAAKRAEHGARNKRTYKYATISDTAVMRAPRYYYEENVRARRRVVIGFAAALVVLVNINWLSHYPWRTFQDSRQPWRSLALLQDRTWDFTREKSNSLSDTTRRVLDTLQGRLQIYSFLPEGLTVHDVPVAEEMRRFLIRLGEYNPQVSVTFADAVSEPELAGRLAAELDMPAENLDGLLVADYQGRRLTLNAAILAAAPDWRRLMAGDERWVFDGENRMTQTIMYLVDPRVPNIFFTYGHLEQSLSSGPYPDRSASRLALALAGANMRVRQHSIAQAGPIPANCDVLVLAAAAGPDYTAAGDPLNDLLFSLGGDFRDDVVEDQLHNDNGQALVPQGIGRGLGDGGGVGLFFPFARTIRDNPRAAENGWTTERLIETFPEASATGIMDGAAKPGPFTLVYRSAMEVSGREARVVVMSSGRMVSDADIGRGANEALALAMVQWLAGREETRDLPTRTWIDRRLTLTGAQLRGILWVAVVGMPLAWLLAGISAWWLRRD